MDTLAPSKRDEQAEGEVIAALRNTGIHVTSCRWKYLASVDEWQLFVFTPLLKNANSVDADRPRDDALRNHAIAPSLRRRVMLKSAD